MAQQCKQLDKVQFWQRLFKLAQHSGLTITRFCAKHKISESSFYHWRRILQDRDRQGCIPTANNNPVFAPVHIVDPNPADSSVEIVLTNGRVIRLPANFRPDLLRQLLRLVEEQA